LLLNLADIGSDGAIARGDFGVADATKSSNVGGDCCAAGKGTFASFWGGFAEKLLRVKPTATIRIAAMAAFKIGSDSFWFAEGGSRSRTSRTILCQITPTVSKKLPSVRFETDFLSDFTATFGGTLLTFAATAGGVVVAESEAVGAIGFCACNGGSAANFFPFLPKFPIEAIKALIL
jgi:hypothetical protein